jgi:hypothetical protein
MTNQIDKCANRDLLKEGKGHGAAILVGMYLSSLFADN